MTFKPLLVTAKVVRPTGSDVVASSQLESVAVMATFGPTALPADVQAGVGEELGQIERHRAPVEQVAQHDRNACLLYTSPSPRD